MNSTFSVNISLSLSVKLKSDNILSLFILNEHFVLRQRKEKFRTQVVFDGERGYEFYQKKFGLCDIILGSV